MKLAQVTSVAASLGALAQCKLPAKTAYRVARAMASIKPEVEAFDAARLSLAEQYGKRSDDGQRFEFDAEGAKAFDAEMTTLVDQDVAVVFQTVTPDELGSVEIEPAHLFALDGIFIKE